MPWTEYQAHEYEYPIALYYLPDGRPAILHCPDEYCQMEIELIETGFGYGRCHVCPELVRKHGHRRGRLSAPDKKSQPRSRAPMTGFVSAQSCEPGRARMNNRFSVPRRLMAESRRYTAQLV